MRKKLRGTPLITEETTAAAVETTAPAVSSANNICAI